MLLSISASIGLSYIMVFYSVCSFQSTRRETVIDSSLRRKLAGPHTLICSSIIISCFIVVYIHIFLIYFSLYTYTSTSVYFIHHLSTIVLCLLKLSYNCNIYSYKLFKKSICKDS